MTQLAAPSAMNLMFVQWKRQNYQAQNLSAVGAWMLFFTTDVMNKVPEVARGKAYICAKCANEVAWFAEISLVALIYERSINCESTNRL